MVQYTKNPRKILAKVASVIVEHQRLSFKKTTDLQYPACSLMHRLHIITISNKATNGWRDTSRITNQVQQFPRLRESDQQHEQR